MKEFVIVWLFWLSFFFSVFEIMSVGGDGTRDA